MGGNSHLSGNRPNKQFFINLKSAILFIKKRAEYPTCKGGDESPRAEGTKNMI
jgi:hypothetical protein